MHEAVAHGTSAEVDGPTVTTVMRRGYRFGEKVLRPAMVEVTDHDPDAVPAEQRVRGRERVGLRTVRRHFLGQDRY